MTIESLVEITPQCAKCPIAVSIHSGAVAAQGRVALERFLGDEGSERIIADSVADGERLSADLKRLIEGCPGTNGRVGLLTGQEACQSPARSFRAPVINFLRRLGLAKPVEPTCLN